jgi:hypothetical protein
VAACCAGELGERATHLLLGHLDRSSGPAHLDPVSIELGCRGAGEVERIDADEPGLEATRLDPRDERKLADQPVELARGRLDHLHVTVHRRLELRPLKRLREA